MRTVTGMREGGNPTKNRGDGPRIPGGPKGPNGMGGRENSNEGKRGDDPPTTRSTEPGTPGGTKGPNQNWGDGRTASGRRGRGDPLKQVEGKVLGPQGCPKGSWQPGMQGRCRPLRFQKEAGRYQTLRGSSMLAHLPPPPVEGERGGGYVRHHMAAARWSARLQRCGSIRDMW